MDCVPKTNQKYHISSNKKLIFLFMLYIFFLFPNLPTCEINFSKNANEIHGTFFGYKVVKFFSFCDYLIKGADISNNMSSLVINVYIGINTP